MNRFFVALLMMAFVLSISFSSSSQADTSVSTAKPLTGNPPQELVGKWNGTWDNSASTTAELTIEKVSQAEVSGKYKHSGTKQSPPGEFNFTAPLQEKDGNYCFAIVSSQSGRSIFFVLKNGKLKGEWSSSTIEMKKK